LHWDVGGVEFIVVTFQHQEMMEGFREEEEEEAAVAMEEAKRMVVEVETMAKECCPSKPTHVLIMMSSCVF
jgi:hypothetical protein